MIGLVVFSPEHFNFNQGNTGSSKGSILLYFLFGSLIGFAFLIGGLKMIKKSGTSISPLPPNFSDTIEVDVRLSLNDVIRANSSLFFWRSFVSNPVIILLSIFFLYYFLSQQNILANSYFTYVIIGLLSIPFWLYFAVRKSYTSNKIIQEGVTYTISKDTIKAKNSTIESTNGWSNTFKAIETKSFFFIFTNAATAYIIPKSSFKDHQQIVSLRTIIMSYPFEKKLLKK